MDIKICDRCKGTGKIMESYPFQESESFICKSCKGSGRIYTRKFTISFPYKENYPEGFYALDAEIIKKINLFEKKCYEDS
jgi:DnaJ-class molecular chaperone